MTLLEQIASEVFKEGKPLAEIIEGLVEARYRDTLNTIKNMLRAGVPFQDAVNALVHDRDSGLSEKTARSLAYEAQSQVSKELADENLLSRANEEAKALFQNGVRYQSVVDALKRIGAADIAEKIATDNQKYYRA